MKILKINIFSTVKYQNLIKMAFYPKKRSFGGAFGRRPRRGFQKKRRSGGYNKTSNVPRQPSTIVKAHRLFEHKNSTVVQLDSSGDSFTVSSPLVCTVKLSDLLGCPAFIRAKLLHERMTIVSMSVQFTVKKTGAGGQDPAYALSYLSRDDETPVDQVDHYLKHPTVLKHDLSSNCSRSMSTRDLGTLATSPLICKEIINVGSLAAHKASIKICVPGDMIPPTAGSYQISCYTTYVCKFIGQEDTLSTAEQTLLSQSFS